VGLTLAAWFSALSPAPQRWLSLPAPGATWMAMDVGGALRFGLLDVIFVFFFVDLFDSVGTLVGVGRQGGFLDAHGRLPRAGRALTADAVGTLVGSASGTSTVVAYVESAAGVAAGGRTGLVSVIVSIGFVAAMFLSPVIQAVPVFATAPALILVGCLMTCAAREVRWNDAAEALPAFLTMAGMAFTFSIADGIALGFVSYVGVRLLAGRWREIRPAAGVLAALFVLRYWLVG
jgi:AGZA family xanthine/uracil permease-like MFS transporter